MLAGTLAPVLSAAPVLAKGTDDEHATGEVLVKFRADATDHDDQDAHQQNCGQVEKTIPGINVKVVKVKAGSEQAVADSYARNSKVAFAEVNGVYHATWSPDDPQYPQQWQFNNTGQTGG